MCLIDTKGVLKCKYIYIYNRPAIALDPNFRPFCLNLVKMLTFLVSNGSSSLDMENEYTIFKKNCEAFKQIRLS